MTEPKKHPLRDVFAAQQIIDEHNAAEPRDPVRIIDPASYTDLGNAKRFVSLHQRNIKYVKKWKSWMIWNGKRWEPRDLTGMVPLVEEMITSMINEANGMTHGDDSEKLRKHAKASEAEGRIMATIRLSQGQPGITAEPDDFDNHKYLINVMNGTINLRSGEFREFRREDRLTQMANTAYDEKATAPIWGTFLQRIMQNDNSMISFLQRAAGYVMTGDTSEECIFMLYGTGANGKSKFIDALAFVLGEYARKTAIHTVLEAKSESAISSDVAALRGVRFTYAAEPNKGKRLDEGKIKDITGREKISCCRKYCEPEEWQPQFKMFMSANHKIVFRGADEGIHRRIKFLPFSVKIPDAEKDTNLDQKLHTEAPGILNWMLAGVKSWLDVGLGFPEAAKIATKTYFEEMDTLGEFLEDCCILEPNLFIPFDDLYSIYIQWCEYKRTYIMTSKALSQSLNERDIISDKVKGIRGKKGINLNTSVQSALDYSMPISKCLDRLDRKIPLKSYIENRGSISEVLNNVSNVSNPSIDSDITTNSLSVQSVQSVNNINNIIIEIKALYDHINKPDTINELEHLKENIITQLMCKQEYDDYEDEQLNRIVDDYFKARGWM